MSAETRHMPAAVAPTHGQTPAGVCSHAGMCSVMAVQWQHKRSGEVFADLTACCHPDVTPHNGRSPDKRHQPKVTQFLSGVPTTTSCRAPLQPASATARRTPRQQGVPLRQHLPGGVPAHSAAPPRVTDGSTRAGRGAAGSVQQAAA